MRERKGRQDDLRVDLYLPFGRKPIVSLVLYADADGRVALAAATENGWYGPGAKAKAVALYERLSRELGAES